MLHVRHRTIAILSAVAGLAACSSAPPSEPVAGQEDQLSSCRINNTCPDPPDDPPPKDPPPHKPPVCRQADPSCVLEKDTTWTLPQLQDLGCEWEATYTQNASPADRPIQVAYCPSPGFVAPMHTPDGQNIFGYVGVNVCDHCLPPPEPGHLYFFFRVIHGLQHPTCQGGCPFI